MAEESHWIERAQSAEARLETIQGNNDQLKERFRGLCEALGARVKSDGSIDIDYAAFVSKLSVEGALEVRAIIDEVHNISGAPGDKPKIRMRAGA